MKRSEFIRNSVGSLAAIAGSNFLSRLATTDHAKKIGSFGIQLYSLKDVMLPDPFKILEQLAGFGYKQVESYEGPKGMFWGYSPFEFKKRIDDLGMKLVSSHCDLDKNFEKKLDEAAQSAMKYIVHPWLGARKTIDEYKKIAAEFNRKAELCRSHGLKFAYHNHDYSFKPVGSVVPQDVLMTNTDPALVDFQMDFYWVVAAGADPEQWLNKYPGRFRLCHIKDRTRYPGSNEGLNSVDLGTGTINFKKLLNTAAKKSMEYYIVEQEYYGNGSSINSAKMNAHYLKKLKL